MRITLPPPLLAVTVHVIPRLCIIYLVNFIESVHKSDLHHQHLEFLKVLKITTATIFLYFHFPHFDVTYVLSNRVNLFYMALSKKYCLGSGDVDVPKLRYCF